jgi:hypothetical protein
MDGSGPRPGRLAPTELSEAAKAAAFHCEPERRRRRRLSTDHGDSERRRRGRAGGVAVWASVRGGGQAAAWASWLGAWVGELAAWASREREAVRGGGRRRGCTAVRDGGRRRESKESEREAAAAWPRGDGVGDRWLGERRVED